MDKKYTGDKRLIPPRVHIDGPTNVKGCFFMVVPKKWRALSIEKFGATRRTRTGDLLITNQLLYQLS